jgi:hypothetical protein
VTISLPGIPTDIANMIQDRTLERMFHDPLFQRLLFRSEAMAELWQSNIGERMLFTRAGLLPVSVTPLTPGSDPTPTSYAIEQWEAEARQFGGTLPTHMPTNYVTLAPIFLRNTVALGMQAGDTLNRLVRNRLYRAYLGGSTNLAAAALIGATQLDVASINGFTESLLNGRPTPVSPAAPIAAVVNAEVVSVIGATPLNPLDPFGRGTLFLAAGLAAAPAIRSPLLATNRSRITRVGGGTSVDALVAGNILTMQDIINGVTQLRAAKIPSCQDGTYHVHMSPEAEAQIYADPVFQRLNQSLPESATYRDLAIGRLLGCTFYRNTETPNDQNSGALVSTGASNSVVSGEVGGDIINNAGVAVRRTIIVGGGAIYEKYLDESKFITEAGIQGKIGTFSVVNNGVQIMTQRIRYILRAPQDLLQQVVSQSWSWSGDFACPTDALTTNPARYKRAVVIEHA